MNDYAAAVDDERLDAATRQVLRGLAADRRRTVYELADQAVTEQFCTCITDASDAVEGKLSRIHATLIEAVVQRAQAASQAVDQDWSGVG